MSVPSNLIPTRITQLPDAPSADPAGLLVYVLNGVTYKIAAGDLLQVAGVPLTRQVIAGTALTGGGALSSDVTLSVAPAAIGATQLAASGVTPGAYGSATEVPIVTVDATGRVTTMATAAISTAGYVPTTRQVIAGVGLSGGGELTANVTLDANLSDAAPVVGSGTGVAGVSDNISRADHQHPAVDLADDTQVNGLLGLDNGGTAKSIVPAAGAPVWSGADGLYVGTQGQAGQVYVSGGTNAPTWGSALLISDQAANIVYAGPASGPDAPTSFRALVNADLPVVDAAHGGTGQVTLQLSMNTLAAGVTSGYYLRGDGLNVTMSALQLGDLPVVDIAHGGTGSTTAPDALTALGAYPASNPSGYAPGTVTSVSVVTANGFAGTVATDTLTPAITLTTDLTGLLKGNGTAMSAAVANTDYVPAVMTTAGDLMYGGVAGAATRLGIGGANTLLHGGASSPSYSAVVEADISLSANTTNDVNTSRHGFCPVLPNNSTLFLNGQGNYTLPSGITLAASYSATAFSGQTSVSVTHNFGTYPLVQVVDNTGAQLIPLTVVNNTLNDFTVTFASSTTGTVLASVGSPQPQALTVTAANYTVVPTDRIIKQAAPGKTVTLYTSVGNTGREVIINNASSGNVFVNTTSAQTISGQLTQTLPSFSSMMVYSDGANWWII